MSKHGNTRWAGIDWGGEAHHLTIVNDAGRVRLSREIEHSAEGLDELLVLLRKHGPIAGVAIEHTRHLVIDKLLEGTITVYPINPKISKGWRERLHVDPPKDDARDAFSLAYGLAQLHENFRPLCPDDPHTRELRLLCADEQAQIADRTAKVNQLTACLKQYYPEACGFFNSFKTTSAADFILAYPTPEAFAQATDAQVTKFLYAHNIGLSPVWKKRLAQRHRTARWPHDDATTAAKSVQARALARQVKLLNEILADYRTQIEALFASHPDSEIFASLPGAGAKLAPRLLSHFGTDRTRYQDARGLQALSGTVPLTKKSGKRCRVQFRWACQKPFRNTLHQFAGCTISRSVWARAFYDAARERGDSHSEALRKLASKWLKILYRMWCDNTFYNEQTYLASLREHGSPLAERIQSSQKCQEINKKHLT